MQFTFKVHKGHEKKQATFSIGRRFVNLLLSFLFVSSAFFCGHHLFTSNYVRSTSSEQLSPFDCQIWGRRYRILGATHGQVQIRKTSRIILP